MSKTNDLVEGINRFLHHRGDNGHAIVVRPEAYYNELNITQFICKILVERSANNSHLLVDLSKLRNATRQGHQCFKKYIRRR